MSSVFQPADTQPLDVDNVINAFEENLYHTGFVNETGGQVYPVKVEVVQYPAITMEMSDGSVFKLTVEGVS